VRHGQRAAKSPQGRRHKRLPRHLVRAANRGRPRGVQKRGAPDRLTSQHECPCTRNRSRPGYVAIELVKLTGCRLTGSTSAYLRGHRRGECSLRWPANRIRAKATPSTCYARTSLPRRIQEFRPSVADARPDAPRAQAPGAIAPIVDLHKKFSARAINDHVRRARHRQWDHDQIDIFILCSRKGPTRRTPYLASWHSHNPVGEVRQTRSVFELWLRK
jgi:hypothetical protein